MTIDYDKYNYYKLGNYSNVTIRGVKDITVDVSVEPFMEPLIAKLALAYPKWLIVGRGRLSPSGGAQTFDVYEAGSELGTLSLDTHWRTRVQSYKIEGRRVREAMERKNSRATKNLTKMLQYVAEYFVSDTPAERMSRCAYEVRGFVDRRLHSTTGEMARAFMGLQSYILDSMLDYPDAPAPVPAKERERLHKLRQTQRDTEPFKEALVQNIGTLVHVAGDSCYVAKPLPSYEDPTTITHFSAGTLPPNVGAKLAMLKLCADKSVVDGLGIRTDAGNFFMLPDEPVDIV